MSDMNTPSFPLGNSQNGLSVPPGFAVVPFPKTIGTSAVPPDSDVVGDVAKQKQVLLNLPFYNAAMGASPHPAAPVAPASNPPPGATSPGTAAMAGSKALADAVARALLNSPPSAPASGLTTPNPELAKAFGQAPAPDVMPDGLYGPPNLGPRPPAPSALDLLQQFNQAAAQRPGQLDTVAASNAGTLADLQAQQKALAAITPPTFTPYTPAPYPTPQFAPVPTMQPQPATPTGPALLAALAGLIAPMHAAEFAAAPLQAGAAIQKAQNEDAWRQYQATEAQKDEFYRNAVAAYNNQQAIDLQNRAGQQSIADQLYQAALVNAKLTGGVAGAQATGNALAPLVTQDHAAQAAAGQGTLLQAAIAEQQRQADAEAAAQQLRIKNALQALGIGEKAAATGGALDVRNRGVDVQADRAATYGQAVDQQGNNVNSLIGHRTAMEGIADRNATTREQDAATRAARQPRSLAPQESKDGDVRQAYSDWNTINQAYTKQVGMMGGNDPNTRQLKSMLDAAAQRLQSARDAFAQRNPASGAGGAAGSGREFDFVNGRLVPRGGR
jgi:hypothetical protein